MGVKMIFPREMRELLALSLGGIPTSVVEKRGERGVLGAVSEGKWVSPEGGKGVFRGGKGIFRGKKCIFMVFFFGHP